MTSLLSMPECSLVPCACNGVKKNCTNFSGGIYVKVDSKEGRLSCETFCLVLVKES